MKAYVFARENLLAEIDTYLRQPRTRMSARAWSNEAAKIITSAFQPETIRSVTFYCGIRTVRREIGGVIFTDTIRDCLKFNFPFGVEGSRGSPHPPPRPEQDPDDLCRSESGRATSRRATRPGSAASSPFCPCSTRLTLVSSSRAASQSRADGRTIGAAVCILVG